MTLHVTQQGSGPAVLLVHAGGLDSRMWGPLTELLHDRFTLLAPDLRGHGHTPPGHAPFSHAEDLLAVMDAAGLQQAAVVGASFGGGIALELATLVPERVTALVLFAATLSDHDDFGEELPAFWEAEEQLLTHANIEGAVELGVETWVKDPATADLVASMTRDAFLAQLGADDVARELPVNLPSITASTLAVSGGLDFPVFAAMADRIAREVPDAKRAEVPDAGHLIALERPEAAARLMADFFA